MESDTIASNRSRLVQISEGLYQHNRSGEYYARFWCKGKRIQQKLGTTESPCLPLAEARRLFRDLKHSTEHIDTSKFNKTLGKVIHQYEAILHCAPQDNGLYKKLHLKRLRTEFPLPQSTKIRNIQKTDVQKLRAQYDHLTATSWSAVLTVTRDVFKHAVQDGIIAHSPAATILYRPRQDKSGKTSGQHCCPPPYKESCMGELERFLHSETNGLPVLLRAALAHVQFETIHPFLDGNGRLGRLLIALLLHHGGLLAEPLLYLSLFFKENRPAYYDLLDRVRSAGDWEAWVDFFLEGVEQTARGAVQTARRLVDLFEADTRRIQETGRAAANALRVLAALRQRPALTLKHLRDVHGMTFPTASKAMQALLSAGIVRELTGQRRNRVFVYDAYLAVLNEGGQPL